MKKLLLLLAGAIAASAQTTTVTVSSTPIISNMPRLGINLYSGDSYSAGQINKNLLAYTNPNFEPQEYNSYVWCKSVSGDNCSDGDAGGYDTWPTGFWVGATYQMVYGSAVGQIGTITASNNNGTFTTFTLSASRENPGRIERPRPGRFSLDTAPAQYDGLIIHKTLNSVAGSSGNPITGWYTTGCTATTGETHDIASTSAGVQALAVTALISSDCILQATFDSGVSGTSLSFAPLNGTYQLQFSAKQTSAGASPNLVVAVARSGVAAYLSQTPTLSNSWQTYTYTFTASESSITHGGALVRFDIANQNIELDDISLVKLGTSSSNTTVFRDEVVNTLEALNPGVLRDWPYFMSPGATLANEISAAGARRQAAYNANYTFYGPSPNYNFGEFLQLCALVGVTDPWIVVPVTWDNATVSNFMAWLAGPAGTTVTTTGTISANSTSMTVASASGISTGMLIQAPGILWGATVTNVSGTTITLSNYANFALSDASVKFMTWGGARANIFGQIAPWTSLFNMIHLEIGNENWNGCDGGKICATNNPPTYSQLPYATVGDSMIAAAKASPYYSASKFKFIMGAQVVNSGTVGVIVSNSPHVDAISVGPYWSNDISSGIPPGTNCPASVICLFEQGDAEIEADSTVTGTPSSQDTYDAKTQAGNIPLVVYETNVNTYQGNTTQSVINEYEPSVGVGLMAANQLLLHARQLGIRYQNLFNLVTYNESYNRWLVPTYGVAPRMGSQTNWFRPQFLAEQIANTVIGTGKSLITTTQSGANPAWNQQIDFYGNPWPASGTLTSHFIQSYAFSDGSIILVNVDPTSSHTVQLAGSPLPSGAVTEYQLTSANITDNNESSNVVGIITTNYTNFDPSSTITLPAFSMTAFVTGSALP